MGDNFENSHGLISFRNPNGFPPTICIQLLKWCNLTCLNCRAFSSPLEKEILAFEQLSSLLLNLRKYGNWRISLTGGEPFFWKKLPELLETINHCGYPFSVTTNGFASEKMFDAIAPQLWQNGTLYVSIDGNKITHDAHRIESSYEKALKFIKHCRPYVSKINVNTVLFADPKFWYKELYDDLAVQGINNWTIISPVKTGRSIFDPVEKKAKNSYQDWYDLIKQHVELKNAMTSTFLDFAAIEGIQEDIVFINSNGMIRLPGIYNSDELPVKEIELADQNVAEAIVESVNQLLFENQYIR